MLTLKSRTVNFTQYLLSIMYWTQMGKFKQDIVSPLNRDYNLEQVLKHG